MKKSILLVFYVILWMGFRLDAHAASFPLEASYQIDTSWQLGYQAEVTITNNTPTPTTYWTAVFVLPQGQSISSLWDGEYTANGQTITVQNPLWVGGGVIGANSSASFGMIVTKTATGTPALKSLKAVANGVIAPTIPSAPVLNAIILNSGSTNSYNVSWASSTNATSYTLQQSTTSSFANPTVIATGNILTYAATNQPNGTYYYRVSATNANGTSAYSNVQSITINTTIQLAAPVIQAINNPQGSNQYTINWSTVSNALGYTLQESTSSSFSNPTIVYQGTATSYQLTGKAVGTYYYSVTAYAGNVTSAASTIVSTTVIQVPVTSPAKIEGYWETWDSKTSVNTIVNMHADILDIAFGRFTSNGNHTYTVSNLSCSQATLTQFITAAHQAGKKVKISIGGASYKLSAQLLTTADAVGMAQAVATFIQTNNLDGVDFDIEDKTAANLQVALIQNCRSLLGDNAIISYTPGTPAYKTAPFDQVIPAAHPYLTDISFMAYDYGSGYTYQQDVTGLIALGVPASKLYIGLMPGKDDQGVLTSVSDITAAAEYVLSQGLGGIMFWDLNRDHENLTGLGVDAATNAVYNVFSTQ